MLQRYHLEEHDAPAVSIVVVVPSRLPPLFAGANTNKGGAPAVYRDTAAGCVALIGSGNGWLLTSTTIVRITGSHIFTRFVSSSNKTLQTLSPSACHACT